MTGIRTIEDIRDRCVLDEDTGCWMWAGAMINARMSTPSLRLTRSAWADLGVGKTTKSGLRAAWLLAGKRLPDGHIVWRSCCNSKCINPAHLRAGDRDAFGRHVARNGIAAADPSRRARLMLISAPRTIPPEVIRAIESDIQAGRSRNEIRDAHGVSLSMVSRVATGQHQHQRGRLVPGASVFALGAAR
jgi:hypothetical protein